MSSHPINQMPLKILLHVIVGVSILSKAGYCQSGNQLSGTYPAVSVLTKNVAVGWQSLNEPGTLLQETNEELWLIHAKCTSLTHDPDTIAHWTVDHIFNGPKELMGQQFGFNHAPTISHVFPDIPVPQVGYEAIWVVQVYDGRLVPSPGGLADRKAYGVKWPIIKDHPNLIEQARSASLGIYSNYDVALEYAQSIEGVVKAEPKEQLLLVETYAESSLPQRSTWAISTLAESRTESKERAPQTLLDLLDKDTVPLLGKIALDEGLERLETRVKVQWDDTTVRFKLWQQLVASSADPAEAEAIVSRLIAIADAQARKQARLPAAQQQEKHDASFIGVDQVFDWLRVAAANAKWSPTSRASAIRCVGWLVSRGQLPRSVAWEFLLPFVEQHPEFAPSPATPAAVNTDALRTELAEGAISGIGLLRPLTSSEAEILRSLQARVKSADLKIWFDDILDSR